MKNVVCVLTAVLALLPSARGQAVAQSAGSSYYVRASGSNDHDGLSEAAAFRTLTHAVSAARDSNVKTITVIGTLNQASEGSGSQRAVFLLMLGGKLPILITGIPNAPPGRRAVLSALGTQKDCVNTFLNIAIRFEHIEISGSAEIGLEIHVNSDVTLGEGTAVRDNAGGGVVVQRPGYGQKDSIRPGSLILDGGIIEDNQNSGGGGGIIVLGAFTMKRGSVRNNTALPEEDGLSGGGGIEINSGNPVSIEGGDISGNTAGMGGGIFILTGHVTMSGGRISGNTATTAAGGILVTRESTFTQRGGVVSGNYAPQYADIYREDERSPGSNRGSIEMKSFCPFAVRRDGGVLYVNSFVC
jgi:hypothetical protein